ncbi:nuclear transport factor 2 family protein [Neolewinella persica]|uniref:nuclear transport factor 2 family protein n=1 Tax=Neolewinella persica TaxID=70998 RepID=UPI0003699FB3|nr:hypothetical protein [Neolewinella persica]
MRPLPISWDNLFPGSETQTLRYDAKRKSNGKLIDTQAAHLWTLKNGKVTAFQQYVDTKQLAEAAK